MQWGIAKLIDRVPILKRHPGVGGDSVGTELGRLAYWLVWLVGLIAALQPLGLSGVLTPVTALTNEVFAFLPRLLGAGLFFSAFLFGELPIAALSAAITGLFIVTCSMLALYRFSSSAEWSNLALGSWAVVAPFVLGFASDHRPSQSTSSSVFAW